MEPLTSERNLTPNSTATVSGSVGLAGVAVGAQILVPAQLPLGTVVDVVVVEGTRLVEVVVGEPTPTVTVTPAPGVSMFPLSSTDRLFRVTDPDPLGVQL